MLARQSRACLHAEDIRPAHARRCCTPNWRPPRAQDHRTDPPDCLTSAVCAPTSSTSTADCGAAHSIPSRTRQAWLQIQVASHEVRVQRAVSLPKFPIVDQSRNRDALHPHCAFPANRRPSFPAHPFIHIHSSLPPCLPPCTQLTRRLPLHRLHLPHLPC